ncbi:50S ribosomal protein L35ae [Candidatus Parvarchaeota archaeon]|nr:50S ribosomal protein L35ae [Candidatus Parvarchaeota archaeon]
MSMEMKIVSFRRGRKTQRSNQAIIKIQDVADREAAKKFIGKKVSISFSKRPESRIVGVITRLHGDNGKVVARFRRGLPGQALTKELDKPQ